MSLKAKIEAVIYASEEPVTLPQLIGLLGHEAQAELELEAAAHSDPTLDPGPDALNNEVLAASKSSGLPEAAVHAEPVTAGQRSEAPVSIAAGAEKDPKAEKDLSHRLRDHFRTVLEALIADYSADDRGIEVREVAGGYRLATKPEYHDAVRGFVKSLKPPLKLSLQALETLAVVAYKQPVTAPEISEIRGVDTAGVLGSLIARKLITTAGRKQVIGRPILYKTTRDFLLRFGLKDISELPSIEEFEKMAGELADAEQETPMSPASLHSAQADGSPSASDNPLDIAVDDALARNPVDDDKPLTDDFSDIAPIPHAMHSEGE